MSALGLLAARLEVPSSMLERNKEASAQRNQFDTHAGRAAAPIESVETQRVSGASASVRPFVAVVV